MNIWSAEAGKRLESLVARIEAGLAPKDFVVEVRKPIVNDEGQQVAEFDVYIEGPVGSASVKWLIECRDRPSGGPAPASWIEQLVGRRTRFGLDKVFAVSTTGFADSAKKYATEQGIGLRHVTQIEKIAEDFRVRENVIVWLSATPAGVMDLQTLDIRDKRLLNMPLEDVRFRRLLDSDPQEFGQFALDGLQSQGKLPPPGSDVVVTFVANEALQIETPNGQYQIARLQVNVRVRHVLIQGRGLLAMRYGEEGRVIGEEGEFHWDFPEGIRATSKVIIVYKQDGTMDLHIDLPKPLPSGVEMTSVSLYGKE